MKRKSNRAFPGGRFHSRFGWLVKWLSPGIGIKRWIGLSFLSVLLIILGSVLLRSEDFWVNSLLDIVLIFCGIVILALSFVKLIRSFITAFIPSGGDSQLFDMLYHKKQLGRGPKIVTVGGGTGMSVLLTGLKEYTFNNTAIVTVADDGGSSGRLRQEFDILPPGDIRNCLVALADAPTLMRDLFQFRFDTKSELGGHSFGNLFITVMTQLTGDFEKAIKETSRVLALKGQVIPATLSNVVLAAEYKDGTSAEGEAKIPKAGRLINRVYLKPDSPSATPEAIKAIEEAQVIILGPGSLYTSIIPNLLIKEITDAIVASQATKVYVCNIMTQPGETGGFRVSDHIKTLVAHSHPQIFDYCIVNIGEIPANLLKRYAQEDAYLVVNDIQNVRNMGYRVIEEDIVNSEGLIRHDPQKLSRAIIGLVEEF
ncbi:MAG: uridine diphosphate-N-acetylglucosamine-binding protein YvcK [Candidatus Omnitrophica bacterium]|jgi:uncharacterized cofD-like protein|nr:uridine diphosphate-N-acetylglucosamine-binding protein YvcK [Candidatus Omnitrophota bacterium]